MAELKAGGLAFLRTSEVTMAEEVLYLSPSAVKVDYVFENTADRDIETVVAFPMPEIGGSMEENVAIDAPEADNFLGFSVMQDGTPITPQLQQRALVAGLDMTAELTAQAVPLLPTAEKTRAAIAALPEAVKEDWRARGLIYDSEWTEGEETKRESFPAWTLHSAYWWKTTFPARAKVTVSHRYRPSVGGTVAMTFIENGKPAYNYAAYKERFCIDDAFMRQAAKLEAARAKGGKRIYVDNWMSYVLTTGANWHGPIGRFRLIVDKGDPDNYVSFCGENVRKTGPTTFEMTATDFWPQRDIDLLILKPVEMEE